MSVKALGHGVVGALALADAAESGKKYHRQQRLAQKRVTGPHAPGGAPPMRKVSARQALNHYLRKQAAPKPLMPVGELARNIPAALGLGAGLAAGGLAVREGGRGVAAVHQRLVSKRMFEELKRRYPEIRRNEAKAKEAFDLAIAYAPSLLKHPAAIGDFVRRQLEFPMSSHEYLKQLADLEGAVGKSETYGAASALGQGAMEGGRSMLPLIGG